MRSTATATTAAEFADERGYGGSDVLREPFAALRAGSARDLALCFCRPSAPPQLRQRPTTRSFASLRMTRLLLASLLLAATPALAQDARLAPSMGDAVDV